MIIFDYCTNRKFADNEGHPCKIGTDGKHLKIKFEDDSTITTSSITDVILMSNSDVFSMIEVYTRNSVYKFAVYHCNYTKIKECVDHLLDIAKSNKLYGDIQDEINDGINFGTAIAHAITEQCNPWNATAVVA